MTKLSKYSVLWTLIYQCTVNTISHKCTGDTKFGVRIVTNLGHQIWCPGDTKFFTVQPFKMWSDHDIGFVQE